MVHKGKLVVLYALCFMDAKIHFNKMHILLYNFKTCSFLLQYNAMPFEIIICHSHYNYKPKACVLSVLLWSGMAVRPQMAFSFTSLLTVMKT